MNILDPGQRPMTVEQFQAWLFQWFAAWDALHPDDKVERTLEDWLGSLDAFAQLQVIATLAARR